MADTIRTLSELNQQFADNVSAVIAPQDIRDLMVSLMVHGEIGSLAKAAITLGTGFQALDYNQSGAIERGITVDTVNKWMTIPVNGKYEIVFEVSFNGANNITYDFGVFRDSGAGFAAIARLDDSERIVNAAMIGGCKVSCSMSLNAGDKVQAGVRSNGASFTLRRGLLRVRRIGVE
jgi:hypothetical protein